MNLSLLFLTILGLAVATIGMESEPQEYDDAEDAMYYEDGDQEAGLDVNKRRINLNTLIRMR